MNRLCIVRTWERAYSYARGRTRCPIIATLLATNGRNASPDNDRSFHRPEGDSPFRSLFAGIESIWTQTTAVVIPLLLLTTAACSPTSVCSEGGAENPRAHGAGRGRRDPDWDCADCRAAVSIRERRANRDETGDPWNARTREWSMPPPPLAWNWIWERNSGHAGTFAGASTRARSSRAARRRQVLDRTGIRLRPDSRIVLGRYDVVRVRTRLCQ
jgi:hypothetical protein